MRRVTVFEPDHAGLQPALLNHKGGVVDHLASPTIHINGVPWVDQRPLNLVEFIKCILPGVAGRVIAVQRNIESFGFRH
jgi:hypothetical protein